MERVLGGSADDGSKLRDGISVSAVFRLRKESGYSKEIIKKDTPFGRVFFCLQRT